MPNQPNEETYDVPDNLRRGAAKGLFNFIQIVGVAIRKSGSVGIMEDHILIAMTPPPKREEFDAVVQAMCDAGLVRRVTGHGGKSAVLFWVGPNPKKGVI
jgi:hypothetical protein